MVLGQLDTQMQKNEVGLLSHILHKNELKMDIDLNLRAKTIRLF